MTQPAGAEQSYNGSILVADDDSVTQFVVQKMLQQAGYKAHLAGDGQEAVDALASGHYDLVLMDCNMPHLDGFAATQCIRNDSSGRFNTRIPIIALSGITSEGDRLRCIEAGMDTILSKPVNSQTLIATIENHLGNHTEAGPDEQPGRVPAEQTWEDSSFLDTLITKFLEEVPTFVSGLQKAASCENLGELQHLGHKLRGATAVLNFSALSTRSNELELAAKAGDLQLSSQAAKELIEELHQLTEALQV